MDRNRISIKILTGYSKGCSTNSISKFKTSISSCKNSEKKQIEGKFFCHLLKEKSVFFAIHLRNYKTFINTFKSICFSCIHFKFNVLNPWIQGQFQMIQVLQDIINLFINFIQSLIIHSSSKVLHVNQVHIDSTYYKTRFIPSFHSQFQVQILFQIQLFKAIFKNQLIILQRNLQSLCWSLLKTLNKKKTSFKFHEKLTRLQSDFWIPKSSPLSFNFLLVQGLRSIYHPKCCSRSKNIQLLKFFTSLQLQKKYVTKFLTKH